MPKLSEINTRFEQQLAQIREISEVHTETQEFILGFIDAFKQNAVVRLNPAAEPEFKKMRDQIVAIKDHPKIKEKYEIIYSQSLVLLVSAFESAMNEVFKLIINEQSSLITWPTNKKIQIDVAELGYEQPTPGDLILKAFRENTNFQNPDSTLRFCTEYLGLRISFPGLELLKFFFTLRHVVAHNGSKVDPRLIDAARLADRKIPAKGEFVKVGVSDYLEADTLARGFLAEIVTAIQKKAEGEMI